MKISVSPNRTVSLDNVWQNNIVYVDLSKKLEESIFEQQYRKTARIISRIIEKGSFALEEWNSACRNCKNRTCHSCRYRDRSSCDEGGRPWQSLTEFQTAVPFIGDRGTGKTSVMYSILERLKDYGMTDAADAGFKLDPGYDEVRFVTFDMIDANVLRNTEDVMEIILSRMLTYLEELRPDDSFRELYRQIDELHEDLCLVQGDKKGKREEYGLASLQHVADSQKAVENFRKLVREFLQTMGTHKFNSRRCFLVVALDDIDMYQGAQWGLRNSQFALLEHIYCHLRIPGLIVLMTYNEQLLKRICNRHFEEIYYGEKKPARPEPAEQRDIDGLTAQFMSKMFPVENRVYMPDYMLVDAADRPNLFIRPILNKVRLEPFKEDKEISVKEFMLRLIAYKTGVYFDAAGTKKHFFEPRNLRDLGELFRIINAMQDYSQESQKKQQIQQMNRQELLDYLYNEFALRNLSEEEYEEFRDLSMLPMHRQTRTLVDKIRRQRMEVTDKPDDFGYLPKAKEDRWRYSYGELLHNIYFSTRISKARLSHDTFYRKEFMHCILGTHSVQMNEALLAPKSRQTAMQIIGSSVAGRWANKMLPKFAVSDYVDSENGGSISLSVRSYFDWTIPSKVQEALPRLDTGDREAEKDLRDFLEALVLAGMFFTSFPTGGLGVYLDAELDDAGEAKLCIKSSSEEHICFNVMNFVISLYDALPEKGSDRIGYLPYIWEALKKLGVNFAENLTLDWEKRRIAVEDQIKTLEAARSKPIFMKYKKPSMINVREQELHICEMELERIHAWEKLAEMYAGYNATAFLPHWERILHGVIQDYIERINNWKKKSNGNQLALPVQNFDMMYNILKRLANVSYHDIPDDALVEDVFDYYVQLYRSMDEELRSQDRVYFGNENGFSKTFRDTPFYQTMTAVPASGMYNPYIREVLSSMVEATFRAQKARTKYASITL